jgi:hypothetical protein
MPTGKIVLVTVPYDQGDILRDFLDWHLELGIDLILATDGGSTDGSRDVLEEYRKTGRVLWSPLPERDLTKYAVGDELASRARDEHGAAWIILCDVDEFLCTTGADLQTILAEAERDGLTLLTIPRRTMTGPPLQPGQRATQSLTLRIDRTVEPTAEEQVSWNLPAPFAFLEVGGHLAIRASAFARYGPGAHVATTTWGKSGTNDQLYILHFAMRGSIRTSICHSAGVGTGVGGSISRRKADSEKTTISSSCRRSGRDNWSKKEYASSIGRSPSGSRGRTKARRLADGRIGCNVWRGP